MLPFIPLVSWTIVFVTTFVVANPLSIGMCGQTVMDEELPVSHVENQRAILIQKETDLDPDSYSPYQLELQDDGEYRSANEWRKIRRYIKRKLKVPKRYLKKIVRKLNVASSLRSTDGEDMMVSILPTTDSDDMSIVLGGANGRFDTKRLLVVDDKKLDQYFAIIRRSFN